MGDPTIRVTAAVIRQAGKILIARRPAGDPLAGCWEFPGGKIETGESARECLARELREEFGVDAVVGRFVTTSRFAYPTAEIELIAYEAELAAGELSLSSHDRIAWARADELLDYELAPADIPIAETLIERDRSG